MQHVVVGFELKMGNRAGTMSLCIPYNVIEPIMGVLAAQNWFSYQRKGGQEDHFRKLTKNVNNAPVEVRAFLAQNPEIAAGMLKNTDENLAHWIRDPQGIKKGVLMPNLGINETEAKALVAFLRAHR